MSDARLRSTDGSDASDGLTWANAKATLAGAFAVMTGTNFCYVSQVHAESAATPSYIPTGTVAAPSRVVCASDAADPPTATATGATFASTTGNMTIGPGFATFERLTFNCGSGANNVNLNANSTSTMGLVFDTCAFNIVTTSTSAVMAFGSGTTTVNQYLRFNDCTFTFANVNQNIVTGKQLVEFYGGSMAATGTVPTDLFNASINAGGWVDLIGVDLTALGSGKNLVAASPGGPRFIYRFMNCKLGASVSVVNGSFSLVGGPEVWLFNCNSGDVHISFLGRMAEGSIDAETTIVMTGGSSDGATTYSTKMSPSANVSIQRPLYTQWIYGPYIDSLGAAMTASVEVVCDNASNINNNEMWLELYYQGTSGSPLAIFATDRITSHLTTAAAQTSSSATWSGTGGFSSVKKFTCDVAFTPQERGVIMGRVACAKVSPFVAYVNTEITAA